MLTGKQKIKYLWDSILASRQRKRCTYCGGKNAGRHIELFSRLFPLAKSLRISEYGSSWGYTTYQFKEAGHQVKGFEISRTRAAFGTKNLGVEICVDEK